METGVYELKKEFFQQLNITDYQYTKKKNELFDWLGEFFDYEILEDTHPIKIKIIEVFGEYRPLPRKGYDVEARMQLTKQKKKDYTEFTIAALGTEFKPNSASKIAREAIEDFGNSKYGHISNESVAERYVRPAMKENGESSEKYYWVWYSTYEKIDDTIVTEWQNMLRQHRLDEKHIHEEFLQYAQNEQTMEEAKERFLSVRQEFINKYHDIPIRVREWKWRGV